MRHPKLPPEQEIEVSESAASHYREADWVEVDAPTAVEGGTESPAEPAQSARRRAPKEADQQ